MGTLEQHLKELLDDATADLRGVAVRRMFGCDAFFADGQIFALVWKEGRIGLRLPDAGAFAEVLAMRGGRPWTIGAKKMSHWAFVPEDFHDDEDALGTWVRKAHQLALAGEAKTPRKPAPKKAAGKKPAAKKAPPRRDAGPRNQRAAKR